MEDADIAAARVLCFGDEVVMVAVEQRRGGRGGGDVGKGGRGVSAMEHEAVTCDRDFDCDPGEIVGGVIGDCNGFLGSSNKNLLRWVGGGYIKYKM